MKGDSQELEVKATCGGATQHAEDRCPALASARMAELSVLTAGSSRVLGTLAVSSVCPSPPPHTLLPTPGLRFSSQGTIFNLLGGYHVFQALLLL